MVLQYYEELDQSANNNLGEGMEAGGTFASSSKNKQIQNNQRIDT